MEATRFFLSYISVFPVPWTAIAFSLLEPMTAPMPGRPPERPSMLRTTAKFTRNLIYDENFKEGKNFIMDTLPRKFYEAIKGLTAASIREIVGATLTNDEIASTIARKNLMLAWLEKHIKEKGEVYVLYDLP